MPSDSEARQLHPVTFFDRNRDDPSNIYRDFRPKRVIETPAAEVEPALPAEPRAIVVPEAPTAFVDVLVAGIRAASTTPTGKKIKPARGPAPD